MFIRIPYIIVIFLALSTLSFAAKDPMKSLFLFQQTMANKGQSSAMMKLGEMYEKGEGVKKSHPKALEMYNKADKAGNAHAITAIQRLKHRKSNELKKKKELEERKRALAAKKVRKQRLIEKEKAEKIQANKARAAKLKEDKLKRIQAMKVRVARANEAKVKATKLKKMKAKKAKLKETKAKKNKKKNTIAKLVKKPRSDAAKKEFKLDPCKGKAARLLSVCR